MSRRYLSPLRYPGGKSSMGDWLTGMFAQQAGGLPVEVWVEPFAGGAGAALEVIDRGDAEEAWLIDANPGIAAFWRTVIDDGADLAHRVARTGPSMDLWHACRGLLADARAGIAVDTTDLGYAAFIINRCSRSGMVTATSGPIGGKTQTGKWTIRSRFTAAALAERIRHVHQRRSRLRAFHGDGIAYLEGLDESGLGAEVVAFVDPPYIREGNRLYDSGMTEADHARLAAALNTTASRWMLTYDDEPLVSDVLYPERRVLAYDIRNSAAGSRVAREFAVFSDNLDIRGLGALLPRMTTTWVREHPTELATA